MIKSSQGPSSTTSEQFPQREGISRTVHCANAVRPGSVGKSVKNHLPLPSPFINLYWFDRSAVGSPFAMEVHARRENSTALVISFSNALSMLSHCNVLRIHEVSDRYPPHD